MTCLPTHLPAHLACRLDVCLRACLPAVLACLPACLPAYPTLPYRASHLGALRPPVEEVLEAGVEQRDAVLLSKFVSK